MDFDRQSKWIFLLVISASVLFKLTLSYITYIVVPQPLQGTPSPPGSPWPQPMSLQRGAEVFGMSLDDFSFEGDVSNCDIIEEALKRYEAIIFARPSNIRPPASSASKRVTSLKIQLETGFCDGRKYPHLHGDESYQLIVDSPTATLKAKTQWGVLRGLETFSQLVYLANGWKFFVNKHNIDDAPRFLHRGVLLDTARHFQPLSIMYANLDAMAYNKFNVLHWHIVDDQSFPIIFVGMPELAEKGAYSPKHVYTPEDVQKVIEYARLRGIRVIPEFDTPGHTDSWRKSHPYLVTPCWADGKPNTANYTSHGRAEIIDPTNKEVYKFMKKLFQEVYNVFPDPYVHLGMDEVYYDCWKSNPNISDFMAANGFPGDYDKLQQYYSNQLLASIKQEGKKFVVWQDVVDNNVELDKDAVAIEVWQDPSLWNIYPKWTDTTANLTRDGYETILSACWYLNIISYGQDWKKYYDCDPHDFEGSEEQKSRVLGGEASLWAEYADGSNILSRLWPRASAVGERLWSPRNVKSSDDAQFRLDQMRCNLIRRGISAQPILNGFCGDYEVGMDGVEESNVLFATYKTSSSSSSSLAGTKSTWTIIFAFYFLSNNFLR